MPSRFAAATVTSFVFTCAVGLALQADHGEPSSRLGLQATVAALSLLLALVAPRMGLRALASGRLAAALALLLLSATLLTEGTLGVRRWIPLGPLSLHASSIACPLLIAFSASRLDGPPKWLALLFAAQVIHLAQPDAGQATALAIGAIALIAHTSWAPLLRLGATLGMVLLAALCFARPDALAPVPTVEGIVRLSRESGPPLSWLAPAALAALPLSFFAAETQGKASDRLGTTTARALGAYVLGLVLMGLTERFPVPVLGFGAGPILGVALAIGLAIAAKSPGLRPPARG